MRASFHRLILCSAFLPALMVLAEPEPRYEERVEVERLILDVYVTDASGRPVTGLEPEDVEVRIGRRRALVESVDWFPADPSIADEPIEWPEEGVATAEGRLIVLLFQTDFGRNQARVRGQMGAIPPAIRFVEALLPSDRVAVVQFDSKLKVRSDFTTDHRALEEQIRRSVRLDDPEPSRSDGISLLENLDPEAAGRAATIDAGLLALARGLESIPGAKTVVLFGYGLGVRSGAGVTMGRHYGAARDALARARATVFAFDVTQADYHTLEAGMQRVAEDTGGYYERLYHFSAIAYDRLMNTISGRYEVVIESSGLRRGRHDVSVRVDHPAAYHVHAPASVLIR